MSTTFTVNLALKQLLEQYASNLSAKRYDQAQTTQVNVASCVKAHGASAEQRVQRLVLDALFIVKMSAQENVDEHARSLLTRSLSILGQVGVEEEFEKFIKVAICQFAKAKGVSVPVLVLRVKDIEAFSQNLGGIMAKASASQYAIVNQVLMGHNLRRVGMKALRSLASDGVSAAANKVGAAASRFMSWFKRK